jgi:hypothetical protein
MELFFYLLELSLIRTELSLYQEVGVSGGVVLVPTVMELSVLLAELSLYQAVSVSGRTFSVSGGSVINPNSHGVSHNYLF